MDNREVDSAHEQRADPQASPRRSWRLARGPWAQLSILAAILLIYWPGLRGPFIYDDYTVTLHSSTIRQHWPIAAMFRTPSRSPNSGRPLVEFSLNLNHLVGGFDVLGYHLFNLAVHAGCALLLLGLARRTLALLPGNPLGPAAANLAFAIALLWAVHPLLSECVLYILQRSEMMMAFFFLLTLYAVVRYADQGRPRRWLITAWAACLLGAMCKEVMYAAPLAALLYDRAFLSGSFAAALKRHWQLYAGLAGSYLLLIVLGLAVPHPTTAGFHLGVSAWQYLLTQTGVLLWYLSLCFFPANLRICYDWPIVEHLTITSAATFMAITALGLATLWALGRKPRLGALAAAFFLILGPTSSVLPLPVEVAAERRMYLPLAIVLALALPGAAWVGRRFLKPERRNAIAALVVVMAALALGGRTFVRAGDYQTEVGIWDSAWRNNPEGPTINLNYGHALHHAGRLEEARIRFERALELDPKLTGAAYNLGTVLGQLGRPEQAIAYYRQTLALDPHHVSAWGNMAIDLARTGQIDAALESFTQALAQAPRRGDIRGNYALLLLQMGRADEALKQARQAAADVPEDRAVNQTLQQIEQALAATTRPAQAQ